jgi:putative phosphoesterase
VLVVLSDTHGTDSHRLEGRTLEAVRAADLVIHAGDFTTETVLEAIEREASGAARDETGRGGTGRKPEGERGGEPAGGSKPGASDGVADREASGAGLAAVWGNRDGAGVRSRLPATRVVEWAGVRFVVAHGHDHDRTALSYLGRQEAADAVVVGHSHRPRVSLSGVVAVLNPGSHADPRWRRPTHAELESTPAGIRGRLVTPDGASVREFDLAARA